tara:strand:+ start:92 stop:736 length:645 start_codon:yes stop_codon:yes gene_type:complete
MIILVFDTETTGLPQFRVSPNSNNISTWPYIVQLSYILYDTDKNKIISTYDSIIKVPKEISISEDSSKIHGITNSMSEKRGYDIKDVINIFNVALEQCHLLVGHNLEFDVDMILAESLRNSISSDKIRSLENYCTMKNSKKLCNIKAKSNRGGFYIKYPSLKETHIKLFNAEPKNLHNSFNDIMVCLRCYYYMEFAKDLCKINNNFNALYKKNC